VPRTRRDQLSQKYTLGSCSSTSFLHKVALACCLYSITRVGLEKRMSYNKLVFDADGGVSWLHEKRHASEDGRRLISGVNLGLAGRACVRK
jgi:hypothetical protein